MLTLAGIDLKPRFVPTLALVLAVPLFVGLGLWQLDRADQKRNLSQAMAARANLPPLAVGKITTTVPDIEFRPIQAWGEYQLQGQILIENRKHAGRNGFHVITPMKLADSGRLLLVNRGWIPRAEKPSTESISAGLVRAGGLATKPLAPAMKMKFATGDTDTWPYLDLDDYRNWSDADILPFVLNLSQESEQGFVRHWPQPQANAMMHIGYAVQWFAFALIALVFWLRSTAQKKMHREIANAGSH